MPKRYPVGFRQRAVALVEAGRTVRQVAIDLEISEQAIYLWLRQHRIDTGQTPGMTSIESEVGELRTRPGAAPTAATHGRSILFEAVH